jgi:hypothetical protein
VELSDDDIRAHDGAGADPGVHGFEHGEAGRERGGFEEIGEIAGDRLVGVAGRGAHLDLPVHEFGADVQFAQSQIVVLGPSSGQIKWLLGHESIYQ